MAIAFDFKSIKAALNRLTGASANGSRFSALEDAKNVTGEHDFAATPKCARCLAGVESTHDFPTALGKCPGAPLAAGTLLFKQRFFRYEADGKGGVIRVQDAVALHSIPLPDEALKAFEKFYLSEDFGTDPLKVRGRAYVPKDYGMYGTRSPQNSYSGTLTGGAPSPSHAVMFCGYDIVFGTDMHSGCADARAISWRKDDGRWTVTMLPRPLPDGVWTTPSDGSLFVCLRDDGSEPILRIRPDEGAMFFIDILRMW